MRRNHRLALAVFTALSAAASTASAVQYTWTNPAGGTWSDPANWNPSTGFPSGWPHGALFNLGPSDPAAFAAYPGYTVNLLQAYQLVSGQDGGSLDVTTDKVTLSGFGVGGYNLKVASGAGQTAVLNLINGGGARGHYGVDIGTNGGQATVNMVAGRLDGSYDIFIGRGAGSVGIVNATAGSTFSGGRIYIGATGGTGQVTLDGAGSKLDVMNFTGAGASISLGDATSTGTLSITNGATAETASLNVAPNSTLSLSGAGSNMIVHFSSPVGGNLSVSAGGTLDSNHGEPLLITPTGSLLLDGGTVLVSPSIFSGLTIGGTLTGSGTVSGFARLQPTATLAMSITSPSDHDHIDGLRTPAFGGTLSITATPAFSPQPGDAFDLLDFTLPSTPSTFATLNLPTLPASMSWDTSALYTTGVISVVPEPTSLAPLAAASLLLKRLRTRYS